MMKQYGAKKGKQVFYASENKGIPGSSKWVKAARMAKSRRKKHA